MAQRPGAMDRLIAAPLGHGGGREDTLAPVFVSGRELPQHVVEDAAVHIIFDLVRRIDAAERVEREGRAVGARNIDGYALTRLEVRDAGDREDIVARQTERLARLAVLELQRE